MLLSFLLQRLGLVLLNQVLLNRFAVQLTVVGLFLNGLGIGHLIESSQKSVRKRPSKYAVFTYKLRLKSMRLLQLLLLILSFPHDLY